MTASHCQLFTPPMLRLHSSVLFRAQVPLPTCWDTHASTQKICVWRKDVKSFQCGVKHTVQYLQCSCTYNTARRHCSRCWEVLSQYWVPREETNILVAELLWWRLTPINSLPTIDNINITEYKCKWCANHHLLVIFTMILTAVANTSCKYDCWYLFTGKPITHSPYSETEFWPLVFDVCKRKILSLFNFLQSVLSAPHR